MAVQTNGLDHRSAEVPMSMWHIQYVFVGI